MGCGVHLLEEFRPNSSNCPLNCGEELRRERQETDAIQNRVINDAKRQRWQAWDASLPRLNGIADMKIYVWEWIHLVMVFQVSCNLLYSKIHIYIYIYSIFISYKDCFEKMGWKIFSSTSAPIHAERPSTPPPELRCAANPSVRSRIAEIAGWREAMVSPRDW